VNEAARHFEMPSDKMAIHRKAVRLEKVTLAYFATAVAVVFAVLGSSQALKAAWIEDLLAFLPPIAFLIAARVRTREPDARFPWGYHRAVSIGYLFAALGLLLLGAYILLESAMKLATAEHPSIGAIELFGQPLWLGWLMLAALAYTGLPPVWLGRRKLVYAAELHDKVLYADAEMNKADWMTAGAAALGIVGIGVGLWWADSVAALIISVSIVRDGWKNMKAATGDLMDERATRYDSNEPHPLIEEMRSLLAGLPWIDEARVRVREQGHVLQVEAFVKPADGSCTLEHLDDARQRLMDLDWKVHDVVLAPVKVLPGEHGEAHD